MKIFDCITFFRENRVTNLRFEILSKVVDKFIICESKYDHKGNKKDLNLYVFHEDQVSTLRENCELLGFTKNCPISSFSKGNHIFSIHLDIKKF